MSAADAAGGPGPAPSAAGLPDALDQFLVDTKIPGPYQEVGATRDTVFVHPSIGGTSYLYLVVAEDAAGRLSLPSTSNLALGPSLNPPMTFARVQAALATFGQRGRLASPQALAAVQQSLARASTAANDGRYVAAVDELKVLRQLVRDGQVAQRPEQTDLDVLLSKLLVRIKLARYGFITTAALTR